jgi:hypothetical protein
VKGTAENFRCAYLRRTFHYRGNGLQYFRISGDVVGICILFGIPETDGSQIISTRTCKSDLILKALLFLEYGKNFLVEYLGKLPGGGGGLQCKCDVASAQNAACNRLHTIAERLARWLLTCHDRVEVDRMPLTHEFLAQMLGAPRTTVTLAAGMLHKAGLIDYTRGHVTIKNRAELEEAACECYGVVRKEFQRLGLS